MSNRTNFIRRFVCWILPLLVVLLIGLYLVLAPIVSTYAAAPSTPHHVVAPEVQPDMLWPAP